MASSFSTGIPRVPIKPDEWVRDNPLPPDVRADILNPGGIGPAPPSIVAKLSGIEDPIELRAAVLALRVPEAAEDVRYVRAAINAKGARAYYRTYPKLAEAVLHEVYERANTTEIEDKPKLAGAGEHVWDDLEPVLFDRKVLQVLRKAGVKISTAKRLQIEGRMQSEGVGFDSPRFERAVFATMTELNREDEFDKFFSRSIEAELGADLTTQRRSRAIRVLEQLGIDPKRADDDDWARVALGMVGHDGGADILALAGYDPTRGTGDGFEDDFVVDFPEFETPETVGLIPDNIRNCGDLYYIHIFDRLGVYRAVDGLAMRFFDRLNLGLSDTARRLYVYIKRRANRIPAEDRRRMTTQLFEGGPDGHGPFKLLMGQMVEALIEYTRSQNAGELLTGERRPSIASTRSAVVRSIENIQRYLSRAGGGMCLFLSRESGAQLMECFDILESPELQGYFGGDFTEGMFGIVEQLVKEIDGKPGPPADRMRTLAVHGRRIIRFLADTADRVDTITDLELEQLSEHVQNWLAAYRRPEIEEPDWLDDDRDEEDAADEGPGAEAAKQALEEAGSDTEPDVMTEVP